MYVRTCVRCALELNAKPLPLLLLLFFAFSPVFFFFFLRLKLRRVSRRHRSGSIVRCYMAHSISIAFYAMVKHSFSFRWFCSAFAFQFPRICHNKGQYYKNKHQHTSTYLIIYYPFPWTHGEESAQIADSPMRRWHFCIYVAFDDETQTLANTHSHIHTLRTLHRIHTHNDWRVLML